MVALAWAAALLEGLTPLPWLTLTLSVLVAAAALDIYARSSGNARKAGGPALASALLFAAMLAIGALDALLDLRLDAPVAAAYDVVVVVVAGWLTIDLLAGRWTEATVADLVSQSAVRMTRVASGPRSTSTRRPGPGPRLPGAGRGCVRRRRRPARRRTAGG